MKYILNYTSITWLSVITVKCVKCNMEKSGEAPSSISVCSSSTINTKKYSQSNSALRKHSVGSKSPSRVEKKPCTEISFKDFLNFLRMAYEINGNTEVNPPPECGMDFKNVITNDVITNIFGINESETKQVSENFNLKKIIEEAKQEVAEADVENKFVTLKKVESSNLEQIKPFEKDTMCEASNKKIESSKSVEHVLKRKLNEVIQEGLLDSVLPYVVPKQSASSQSTKKSVNELKKTISINDRSVQLNASKDKTNISSRRKSCFSNAEVEVEIHVCDEIKNLKRNFRCSQKLLVSKMGYFAEVTTGQKLEDMDISVHCDITIFDWLMRWVKQDSLPEENWPKLDAANVIPILVSAAFLQMDPLLQDCLKFCRENMNDIIKTSSNLACLNDSILTRLANLFSNVDLEGLRDKKDKIQSRLYCKLIASLTESSPDPARGHYASLASMYRCGKCQKLVLRQLNTRIPCKPSSMKMDRCGNIHASHSRDPAWNINDYIRGLYDGLKSWRGVYWQLWGDCHFMYCLCCQNFFPVNQMGWCCYHPDPPQFFSMEHQRTSAFPIGRYSCCGARSYRFEVLKNESGCQYRDHVPLLTTERDTAVHNIFMANKELLSLEAPLVLYPERLTKIVSSKLDSESLEYTRSMGRELLWWEGLELAPPRPRHGLLSKIWENHIKKDDRNKLGSKLATLRTLRRLPSEMDNPVSSDAFTDMPTRVSTDDDDEFEYDDDSSSSTDSENSEESSYTGKRLHVTTKTRRPETSQSSFSTRLRVESSRQWLARLSIRSNQDNQRECEEQYMRQMVQLLTRRTCGDSSNLYSRSKNHAHGHGPYHSSLWSNHIIPTGGTYVRLEQEWKDAHSHGQSCHVGTNRQRSVTSSFSARPKPRMCR